MKKASILYHPESVFCSRNSRATT